MSWNAKYILLIGFTTLITYICAILIETNRKRAKVWLLLSLASCLGVLFFFKYFNFVSDSISRLLQKVAIPVHPLTLQVLLPVGISFYTFQTLSYVIDVYRDRIPAERHFGKYAAFITFFPQLVAGPIERSENLLAQIKQEHRFDYKQATYGLKLMVWGFFKKIVIADCIAFHCDRIFNGVQEYQGFVLVLAMFSFSIQIYCDFSGYSDIARGTANLLGFELMENFKSPYFSSSIREFWSRWHISLSTWFRDYVYIPLGGNRVSKRKNYRNLLLTFLISGLWHGANWTFVIWGGIHGAAQILEKILPLRKKKTGTPGWWLRVLFVSLFVMMAWVFFRVQRIEDAVYLFTHLHLGISNPIAYIKSGFETMFWTYDAVRFFAGTAILLVYDYASLKTDVIEWLSKKPAWIRHGIYILFAFAVVLLREVGEVSFVYFQF